jgi:hypothetical protein
MDKTFPCIFEPGIQRDGTKFNSNSYIDGQWCRFYGDPPTPQKMGGYNKMISWDTHIPRGMFIVPKSPLFQVYVGDSHSLKYFSADATTGLAVGNTYVDRTPLLFNTSENNEWSFDVMYDQVTFHSSVLIACPTQNLYSIDQTYDTPIYFGSLDNDDKLVETGLYTSGGVVVLHPYLIIFDKDGYVRWTEASNPKVVHDRERVSGTKIVTGMPVRGGNSSPAGLLWSLDSLIRMTNVGTTTVEFAFDTVTTESSILSNRCVVELDGNYYWAGTDKFYVYNGVVQELPNSMCLEYFFNHLNYAQRQKVWATKVPKYGEIWFFYPSDKNTECDKAVIYNKRLNKWYDSTVNRSCGDYNPVFGKPIWCANNQDEAGLYRIWRHETGVDRVVDGIHTAIDSHFETGVMSWVSMAPGMQPSNTDKMIDLYEFEPDFVQSGDITLIVRGRAYANSSIEESPPYVFNNDPFSPHYKEKIDISEQRRLMTLQFNSSEVGGNYKMGKCLMKPRYGDTRP